MHIMCRTSIQVSPTGFTEYSTRHQYKTPVQDTFHEEEDTCMSCVI